MESLNPGDQLAQYRLIARLGEGGMGVVWRAEDVRLGRHVALKLLPAMRMHDAEARARFLSEARAVSALEHPHICMLYELGESGDQMFLAMKLVEGETLREALDRGPLAEDRTREVIAAVAAALGAAHTHGIVHRDVKSENVLLGHNGDIKLADFGVARLAAGEGLTSAHAILGTPAYLAPEQITGLHVTPAADQFALAVIAYECLTGVRPFEGNSLPALFHAILNHDPVPPSHRRPEIARAWDAVLGRALDKTPERRFDSASGFAVAVAATANDAIASGATSAPLVSSSPAGRSLAVLYFENLSGDPDNDYFCSGVTEDLLTDLARIPGLRVASRNAVARYRGRPVEITQVAAELGVGAVLEGGVRRSGDRVRITAQLVNATDGFQLWAERYDRTLDDVFAVQEDLAHSIAAALRGALTPDEAAGMGYGRPREVGAYDLFLRGRELYQRYTPGDMLRALELFEKAARLDPGYALAWAGIADCCAQMIDRRWETDPSWQERGFAAACRAVALDPRLPNAHKAEAFLWRTKRDSERAIASLRLALEADPQFRPAIINLGIELEVAGDLAGAERAMRRALALDPADGLCHLRLAWQLLLTRRYEETIEASHRAQSLGASSFYSEYAYAMRAHAFAALGRFDAARQELAGDRAAGGATAFVDAATAMVAARAGDATGARELLEKLNAAPPGESYACELAAAAAGILRLDHLTVRFLSAAERIDARSCAYWRISPELAAVRETPAFAELLVDRGRQLVWPSEAPPLTPKELASFTTYAEASGVNEG